MDFHELPDKKIILLSDKKIGMQKISDENMMSILSDKKMEELYRTYEFSDNITYVTDKNVPYPTLFNFVNSGIVTENEVWQALMI